LLREIEALQSNEAAALWSQRRLGAKNTLLALDAAARVEQAFQARLTRTDPAATRKNQSVAGLKLTSDERLCSIKRCWHCKHNVAFAIASMSNLSPSSPA
jgi:hypothetical protein